MNEDSRLSPEDYLAEAERERRGKLKIFLGAAPGVGKTFAMLQAAHERLREGVDIVVGVVETHGRAETLELLQGLDVFPRKQTLYRGLAFDEMDLDGLLQRRPKLALVDELAHTNVPGSKHEKRYQDVEELINAGIDVYTTLNIQHIESLNDVVSHITGVNVRETVPDNVLQEATDIELIDLPPDELVQRLKAGKVYLGEQAQRAMSNFFTPGNLTALRELALRTAAERVDAQMLNYMKTHAVSGPWPTRERILVCLNNDPAALKLVRLAKRSADRRKAPWLAITVQQSPEAVVSEKQPYLAEALRLAEELGGEAVILTGDKIAHEILNFAYNRNVSTIIVAKWLRPQWIGVVFPSVAEQLLQQAQNIDVLVVNADPKEKPVGKMLLRMPGLWHSSWKDYLISALVLALVSAIAAALRSVFPDTSLAVVFTTGILLIASRFGIGPSLASALIGFGIFEQFFAFSRSNSLYTALPLFLLTALVASNLSYRLQRQIATQKIIARRTHNLYEFNRKIAAAASLEDVCWTIVHHVAATLSMKAVVMLPDSLNRLQVTAGLLNAHEMDPVSSGAADWAFANDKMAGHNTNTLPAARWLFRPLSTQRGTMGVLGLDEQEQSIARSTEQTRLLDTLADQAAIAIERATLAAEFEENRLQMNADRLRSDLLASIASDLRIPVAALHANVRSLRSQNLEDEDRQKILDSLNRTSNQLNRFIQNLNDIIRLNSGDIVLKREPTDIRTVIRAALERMKNLVHERDIIIIIPETIPLLMLDFSFVELVLINVIDNAVKYTPASSPVDIVARLQQDYVEIDVRDRGPGIPEDDLNRIFDIFYRIQEKNSCAITGGMGLGLAICRGIINAHGGTISARNNPDGIGATIVIKLPLQ